MGSKTRATIVAIVVLVLAAGYYFRPFWWESYRYENDQVRVRLSTHDGEDTPDLAGTLVLRLTGPGREKPTPASSTMRGVALAQR